MARKPTPKPEAKPETARETKTQTPESTLGDGDATGAAQEAASAGTAPEAPAPGVVTEEKRGPEGWTVRVTGPAKGRWRAGRKFGPEAVAIAADELTDADMEKLMADPELKVEIAENEA